MTALAGFIDELRANPRTAPHADALADAFAALEAEANENGDALEFRDGVQWIVRSHTSLRERARALAEYFSLQGRVMVRFSSRGDRITMTRIS